MSEEHVMHQKSCEGKYLAWYEDYKNKNLLPKIMDKICFILVMKLLN